MPITADPGARTNFINSTRDVFAWIKTRLEPVADAWSVNVFSGSNVLLLFKYIKTLKVTPEKSALVIVYTGSNYGNVPRRSGTFSILSITCQPRHRDEAQIECGKLNDELISRLDQQVLGHMLCSPAFDRGVDLSGTELDCWETGFVFLDH
jgi:hypothetical protein